MSDRHTKPTCDTIGEILGKIPIITPKGIKMIAVGEKFADSVISIARESGLRNFRVFEQGIGEISRSNSPANVSQDMVIRLEPFDVAAVTVKPKCDLCGHKMETQWLGDLKILVCPMCGLKEKKIE
jgi:hypothetical protein